MTTDAGETSPARSVLEALCGQWTGTYRLWLEPDTMRSTSDTRCIGRPVLDGRFVTLDYDWTDLDGPQQGSMLLGCTDEGMWQMAWIDSWHTQSSIMFCVGDNAAAIDVVGHYGPMDEPWGWRTTLQIPTENELIVTAWNVEPDGEELKATEASYVRSR